MTSSTKFFLRDPQYRPFGVVYLSNQGTHVNVGISQCHLRDDWDRKLGTTIAVGRADSGHCPKVPPGETPTLQDLLNAEGFAVGSSRELHPKMESIFESSLAKVRRT